MNDPQPSFVALIVWGTIAALLGYWLCRRRPWLTVFWVAGSICLPVLALVAASGSSNAYRIVAAVALAAGVVVPVLGAIAGGFRFWSEGATIAVRQPNGAPAHTPSLGSTCKEEPGASQQGLRPK